MRGYIPALSGLRGIAAMSVILTHMGFPFSAPSGVTLFFVLSGFLMAHLYLGEPATASNIFEYARARFARIYPLFAFVVVLGLVAYSLDPHFPYEMTGERAIRHFMMIGNHVLTIWTVGIEVQFYAVFAIIWLLLGGPERKDWLLGAVAFGGVLALNVSHDDVGLINLVDAGAFFLIGLLVDIGHRHFSGEAKKALGKALPLFLTLYVLLMFVHADRWAYRSIAFEVVTAGCVLTACLSKGPAQRFLASRPMVFLGEISFGTYLLHRPTIYVLERLLGLGHHTVATTLLTLPCTIAAAYVAYVLIEKPARSCIRNIGRAEPVAA